PVLFGGLDIDDASAASALRTILFDRGPLTKAPFGNRKHHVVLVTRGDHADNIVAFLQPYADNSVCLPSHFTDLVMSKANAHAVVRSNENCFVHGDEVSRDRSEE